MEENKKTSILLILNVLRDYSDEEHYLTQQEIIDHIYSGYGVRLQRKAVANSLDLLEQLGYDINRLPKKGVALLSRRLNVSQIKYLVDAIFSSKNITGKQAMELADCLYSNLSIYQRKQYTYLYKSVAVNRSSNSEFFLNIEILNEAIAKKKKVKFQYATYDPTGKEVLKAGGYFYRVSPYFLVNNFGKYYLLSNYYKYDTLNTYRIDYMRNISILEDEPCRDFSEMKEIPDDFNITDYINDHVYLFSDKVSSCRIRIIHENVIRDIIDWFGKNATVYTQDDVIYADIQCDENAFYFWSLQYGEHIEVLQPVGLAIRLSNHYKEMNEQYKDVLLTKETDANLDKNIQEFLSHEFYKRDDSLKNDNDIILYLRDYLSSMLTSNFNIMITDNTIHIENNRNPEEKYLLQLIYLTDGNHIEENIFSTIKSLKKLEEQDCTTAYQIVLVRNQGYYQADSENPSGLLPIFQKDKEIPLSVSFQGETATLSHPYKINWKAITNTSQNKPRLKYYVIQAN